MSLENLQKGSLPHPTPAGLVSAQACLRELAHGPHLFLCGALRCVALPRLYGKDPGKRSGWILGAQSQRFTLGGLHPTASSSGVAE